MTLISGLIGVQLFHFSVKWVALRSSCNVRLLLSQGRFRVFSQCRGLRKGNIQLQSMLVLWIMFVIQLMHYLEAAGCGTSIQLAPSATVHQSANYFWGFQVLTTVKVQMHEYFGFLLKVSFWNGQKSTHPTPWQHTKVDIRTVWFMYITHTHCFFKIHFFKYFSKSNE